MTFGAEKFTRKNIISTPNCLSNIRYYGLPTSSSSSSASSRCALKNVANCGNYFPIKAPITFATIALLVSGLLNLWIPTETRTSELGLGIEAVPVCCCCCHIIRSSVHSAAINFSFLPPLSLYVLVVYAVIVQGEREKRLLFAFARMSRSRQNVV